MSKMAWYGGAGIVLLLLSVVGCLAVGSVQMPLGEITRILLHHIPGLDTAIPVTWDDASAQIMMKVRFPRVVLAMLVGAALGVAGTAFQGVLRNPLADPYTLGVSSGASVGAAFLIYFGLQYALLGEWTIPVVAFGTGALTLIIVMRLANEGGKIPIETLILSGVVMQAFLGAVVSFLVAMTKQTINEIMFWVMGSLALRGWSYSAVLGPYLAIGIILLIAYARPLNLLALGERQASHLGLHVERTKWVVLLTATLITAAAVSVSGVIGFVGLVVPHILRLIVGPDYRYLIPLSAVGGAIYVMWADTIARTAFAPIEIPLGVVTAFIGAPFFAYLLIRNKRAKRGTWS
ncbi:FecCD family ABC transporter permease [Paenibacillus apiarius]|uniref:Iron ABC transporter permease n=1 Tax=Paenibacillus apiarius TaxID=46240 RepID=A0ABT4DUE9_9BACL|nr:iron ABC transporter permease [Paenibacillus apiarius]MBN3523297.1 iron ABC transporter permease [Paenibacillus apiarius]MCY9514480.1 iron ABC transporter permease [Paenibacillus apiarius]MCY9520982.1 iron ABC transporter permease [Paenibacillus apiarius]MCY9551829.1 iron ABC transporter permease [Paenibacillus apiarius]MCY9557716.1 iron ABC transporter permease [Paenibacillus apiarius]